MRRAYIKKIIFITVMSLIITNIYSTSAYAVWNNANNKWSWLENEQKSIGWKEIDDKWYYFDDNGYMSTGWVQDNNKWYKLTDDGVMVTKWNEIDNEWYYFNESGVMQSGWINDGGKWYHMSPSGIMDKGWKEINEEWYIFNDNGIMGTGWINDNGTWYYADSSGRLEKGTISIDGKTYTFGENGAMLGNLENNQQQIVIESGQDYSKDKTGYVNTNSDALNVRSEASLDSNIVYKLQRGNEVTIVGDEINGFYPISLNGTTSWVSSEWISFEKTKDNKDENLDDNKDNIDEDSALNDNNTLALGGLRTTAPSLNDIHYYSDSNIFYKVRLSPPFLNSAGDIIKGNCTWYAWGRAWELTGKQPTQANFIGNAYEWWEANKKSGKYQYGSEPKVGSIAVWNSSLPGSGGCGHVAVVEKIDNGKIYISESMWHGECFAYKEIYSTEHIYGYIYLDKPNF